MITQELIENIKETLKDLADDLQAELDDRYKVDGNFPHGLYRRKHERDMKPVQRARAILKELDNDNAG